MHKLPILLQTTQFTLFVNAAFLFEGALSLLVSLKHDHTKVSYKKAVLKNFANFLKKHKCWNGF